MNYTTQMDAAKKGIITPEMEIVAKKENITAEELRERVARGSVAIPANKMHKAISPEGVGEGLKTKINVNLGISKDCTDYSIEWEKVKMAVDMKAEAIMDLSCYGKTHEFRQKLIDECPAMIGTVPMYDAVGYLDKELADITADEFLEVIEAHAKEGVDFMTIHAGINRRTAQIFKESGGRLTNIVSRGGSLIFAWMEMTGNENPFYEYYDKVLDILAKYDVTISLGDACRPGSTHDSTDASQITELIELGILTKRAWEKNVQVMVEGPGHMTIDEIAANMKLEKRLCHNAPFYVLGPLVTDIAPGYDHITSAIGGAIAAANGADFLCYVTPAEHLRLPNADDVKEGIVAAKIAAHAADMAKGVPGARDIDNKMSDARRRVCWDEMFQYAIEPEKPQRYYNELPPEEKHTCSMCGKMCAARTMNKILAGENNDLDNYRELYQLDQKYPDYPKVAATVIGRDGNNWFHLFTIDKGKKDGIAVDMNVIAGNGLVGIVSEVGDHYAKVRAIIDDKSNVSAMFENTGETCIVKGNMESIYKGYIDVTMISNNVTAKNGDSVVTSHISDKFLPGLLVGYISDITQETDGLSKSGHLTPVVSFDKLETVLIITTLKDSSEIEDIKNYD